MAETTPKGSTVWAVEEYAVREEPFYLPIGDEVELFQTAYEQRIPVLFKGPTGCGKTRFVDTQCTSRWTPVSEDAWRLSPRTNRRAPLPGAGFRTSFTTMSPSRWTCATT